MFSKKSFVVITALMALFIAFGISADAKKKGKHKDQTFQGEILDMACYVSHGSKGADHAACAKKCLKDGQPMGLLTADGKVFILFADHDDNAAFNETKKFAGSTVTITGVPFEKDGIKGITVHAVKSK
jgi:hypothetical protein